MNALQVSPDGLLRLSIDELLSVPIHHLMSAVDLDLVVPRTAVCGCETTISGYTEWVSASRPAVTIGWDWHIRLWTAQQPFAWTRLGQPRSNVMLVYSTGNDTGWHKNLELLATVVDALPWQEQLSHAVTACCQAIGRGSGALPDGRAQATDHGLLLNTWQ